MAAPFVPVPFPVGRFLTRRGSPTHAASSLNCEPSPPESVFCVRGVGACGATVGTPTPDNRRPREGVFDWSSPLLAGDGSWLERAVTPTLLGYEILEERAKFTVYKILVTRGHGDSWVVLRRYTDFCRLKDKLKKLFPSFSVAVPHKRWFKDNYDEEFLEERQTGLQTFLQNLASHKDIISSEAVTHFLCLVDQTSPFDSLEESRAVCETLEENNHRLQRELVENQRVVDALKKTLEERENHISFLVKKVKRLSLSSERFEDFCQQTDCRRGYCMQS